MENKLDTLINATPLWSLLFHTYILFESRLNYKMDKLIWIRWMHIFEGTFSDDAAEMTSSL